MKTGTKTILAAIAASILQSALGENPSLMLPHSGDYAVSLPSVEASSLCRHVDHPINYSTGTASISYPLYTIEFGELSHTISISTTTGAIKVDQEEGPLGLGWDLDIGGMVSRTVMGQPDEGYTDSNIYAAYRNDYQTIRDIFEHREDGIFDRYTWRAGKYSGVFIINPDSSQGPIVQLQQTDCSISYSDTGGFRIVTPEGMEYRFGLSSTVQYTYTPGITTVYTTPETDPSYSAPCLWYLTSVIGPSERDVISIYYADDSDRRQSVTTRGASFTVSRPLSTAQLNSPALHEGEISASNLIGSEAANTYVYTGRKIPSRITWRGGQAIFSRSSSRITGMAVRTFSGSTVISAAFTYAQSARTKLGRAYQLRSFTISDGASNVLDGASFRYSDCDKQVSKDLFGYNNYGVNESGSTFLEPYESVLEITDSCLRYNHRRLPYSPPYQSGGVYSGAILAIESLCGTCTEFEYEPAWFDFDSVPAEHAFIGIRLRRMSVTDRVSGSERCHLLGYSSPAVTVHPDSLGIDAYVSVGGSLKYPSELDMGMHGYITTGVTMLTASRIPGASLEASSVYYGHVADTITGTGMSRPMITTYEYDVAGVPAQITHSCRAPYFGDTDYKYCGTGIGSIQALTNSQSPVLMSLITSKKVDCYNHEVFCDKAPLKRVIEWRVTDTGTDTLRVTENFYSHGRQKSHDLGFHCETAVRSFYSAQLLTFDRGYATTGDFVRLKMTGVSRYLYRDSTHVREYDMENTCRRVSTYYEYNDHCAAYYQETGGTLPPLLRTWVCRDNSLLYRTTVSCGGDTVRVTNTYSYKSELLSGFTSDEQAGIKARRPALPLMIEYEHMGCRAERLLRYTTAGRQLPFIKLASETLRIDGITVDSISVDGYDYYGNPLSVSRNGGTPMRYAWDSAGLRMLSSSVGPLTTAYTHSPLIGCTSVTSPAGTVHAYSYSGVRLSAEAVAGELTASYSYAMPSELTLGHVDVSHYPGGQASGTVTASTGFDGFGNAVLTAAIGSGQEPPVCTHTTYDALGRRLRRYMDAPCVIGSPYEYGNALEQSVLHHSGEGRPFSATGYGGVPGLSATTDTLPGDEYALHPMLAEQLFNRGSTGDLACRMYAIASNKLFIAGYYPDGSLSVERKTDGDGRVTLQFTDFRGRLILSRGVLSSGDPAGYADTYYIYDRADNLVMVLPPRASRKYRSTTLRFGLTQSTLRDSVYRYAYDGRQLLVKKWTPGSGAVSYWYDAARRPILSQDTLQALAGKVRFELPDSCGRLTLTGECLLTQALVDALSSCVATAERSTLPTARLGYVTGLPMDSVRVFTAAYYDDYTFMQLPEFGTLAQGILSAGISSQRTSNMGLQTGRFTVTLDPSSYFSLTLSSSPVLNTLSSIYYDHRERAVRTVTIDHTGALCDESTTYSNSDKTLSTTISRIPATGTPQSLTLTYAYDSFDRPSSTVLTRGGVSTTLATRHYDMAGRLVSIDYGEGQRQTMDYTTGGALRSISAGPQQSPTFTQTLLYASGSTPSYSGNIGSMTWTGTDGVVRGYRYTYDNLNRLVSAQYHETGERGVWFSLTGTSLPDYSTSYAYDLDSNPLRIMRSGVTDMVATSTSVAMSFGTVDNLSLHYRGPVLTKVSDGADDTVFTGAPDFSDGANSGDDYTYDPAGNLTSDANRGITSIAYNDIGLPKRVDMYRATMYSIYAADGRLLRSSERSEDPCILGTLHIVHYTDHVGPFTYTDGVLTRIELPNGYVSPEGIRYYIKDNQGNIRQVVDSVGTVLQENHYYPYGMLMGESSDIIEANRFGRWADTASNPYRYSGNRLLTPGNAHIGDFNARWYDFQTCRFLSPDPFREKYYHLSPYLYCAGNPIMIIDPFGLSHYYNIEGKFIYNEDDGSDDIFVVLNKSNKLDEIKTSVQNMEYIPLPSQDILDKFQSVFDKTQETGHEFGFYVSSEGMASNIHEGDENSISTAQIFADRGEEDTATSNYTVHSHPVPNGIYKNNPIMYKENLWAPSSTDLESCYSKYPSILLCFKGMEPNNPNYGIDYLPHIVFYNGNYQIGKCMPFGNFKKTINQISKNHKQVSNR